MFGIGKKKDNDVADETQGALTTTPKKKKKAKEMMSSVLQESVVESVLAEFKANERLVMDKDGEECYIGMLLHAEDIGGINKKCLRDEDKGQIIEQISSGRIKTYIPADLLESEDIVIVPDVDTIMAMEEFTILVTAPYKDRKNVV